ncbi:hypothetical protein MNEG_11541 [Monoraphidium neglectum]|uniref:Uncharacterized protein n=1 Tax=Monoraphidium neglectum TaxID=145388 RepID=A0A0D2MNY6_9CHLO|nr:hypothetical protein MNEG_11541 [Monoraphidium neglectum]KIY96420.1 hypothetical protein MNEG_11541 [Monoraphidium neglectum]|eukprot:XP_013895440.1 hypothetical protein MNEG_11541 [Monoraphidium neglectum]
MANMRPVASAWQHQSSGKFLEVPFWSKIMPSILITFGLSGLAVWANKAIFNVPPPSLSPEFKAEAAEKAGVVERISAPPVFSNPIRRGIPGNIRGPEDL